MQKKKAERVSKASPRAGTLGLALVLAAASTACSAAKTHEGGALGDGGGRRAGGSAANGVGSAQAAGGVKTAAAGQAEGPTSRARRVALGEATTAALDATIEPMAGGRSVLFVAQSAGERAAWARRYTAGVSGEAAGAGRMGPALRFVDEYVIAAFEDREGDRDRMTVVTSNGARLCLSTFLGDKETAAERGCAEVAPSAMVPMGDKFALIEAVVDRPPPPPEPATSKKGGAPKEATSAKKKPKAGSGEKAGGGEKSARASVDSGGKKPGVARAGALKKKREARLKEKKSAAAAAAAKRGQAKTEGAKGAHGKATKPGGAPKGGAKKPATAAAPKKTRQFDRVNVRLRWMTRDGKVSEEIVATGLAFEQPLSGMSLIDARARGSGADLAWFEANPKRLTAAPMGSARVMGGTLRADGLFDPASRVPVLEGDLEYGSIAGHFGGRLVTTDAASVFVGLTGRPGGCEAVRVAPSLSLIQPIAAVCSIEPERLWTQGTVTPEELGLLSKIAASEPRRAFGQPRWDPGLAAWAGEEGFYLSEGKLRSGSRKDGVIRDREAPFPARRSRIEWGSFATDGEGISLVSGQWMTVDAAGKPTKVGAPAGGAAIAPEAPRPQDWTAIEKGRAARIGASWWTARGNVERIAPEPATAAALAGRAHPDATALVGGRERGIFLEVIAGRLYRTALDASGTTTQLGAAVESPVRVGFDAVARAGGGAIVAGVSAANPAKVVVFTVDGSGAAGVASEAALRIEDGELFVRMTALPGGGALLSDLGRTQVEWLDNEGRSRGIAAWPAEDSGAVCVDGRPGRAFVPAIEPGKFVRVPELAAPDVCVVGDVAWGEDGAIRWFGSAVRGADSLAEASILPQLAPARASTPHPLPPLPEGRGGDVSVTANLAAPGSAPGSAPAPACPAEMVSIAGEFCIDRFEAMLADAASGEPLSPDYPTTPNTLDAILADWTTGRTRTGNALARGFPLPFLPRWQRGAKLNPVAVSRMGARPSGYVTGLVAESACAAAGKRLCSLDEFTTACRGEDDTQFPYGDTYIEGVCNVFREDHPAALLHNNASVGHLDPRLNRTRTAGGPLLRTTGATPACRSRWGNDAVYDMVGNIDEWVDEEGGAFAGGFYSRSTRNGCEAKVTAHPKVYLDYSTGVRCCKDSKDAADAAP